MYSRGPYRQLQDLVPATLGLAFFVVLVVAPLLGGIGTFGWQVYHWLDAGEWTSRSVLDFLRWAGVQADWVQYPTRWVGLWKLLNRLPLSLTGVVYGGAALALFASLRRPNIDPYAAFWEQLRRNP